MIYIPIMKNRSAEIKASSILSERFGNSIIPYYEIIKDYYETQDALDENGDPIYVIKEGNTRRTRIKKEKTPSDICTLERIHNAISGKQAFVEFFRFADDEYGKTYDISKVELARNISYDYNEYTRRVVKTCDFDSFVPVISIKKGFAISFYDLERLIADIRNKGKAIAIRIQIELFDVYKEQLIHHLTSRDYLFVDLRETPFISQELLLQEILDYRMECKKLVFQSPRPRTLAKREYQSDAWEPLIDNSIATESIALGYDGFGDYAGMKDALPELGGRGTVILALIYDRKKNQFWSVKSEKESDGATVKRLILKHKDEFDLSSGDLVEREINRIKSGNQCNWNTITIVRYVDQIYRRTEYSDMGY